MSKILGNIGIIHQLVTLTPKNKLLNRSMANIVEKERMANVEGNANMKAGVFSRFGG